VRAAPRSGLRCASVNLMQEETTFVLRTKHWCLVYRFPSLDSSLNPQKVHYKMDWPRGVEEEGRSTIWHGQKWISGDGRHVAQ